MKVSLVLIFFLLTVCELNAQQLVLASNSSSSLSSYDKTYLNLKEDAPGQKMIRVGKALTIGGGVLLVGGIALMSSADELYYNTSTDGSEEGDPKGAVGVLMAVGGVGMIIPGAIVWSKVQKSINISSRQC